MYAFALINAAPRSTIDRLDTFFPFDPITLHRSQLTIEPLYNPWDGGAEDDTSSTVSSGSEVDEEEMLEGLSFKTMSLEDSMAMRLSSSIGY
jgi:RNA polymerase I specific transcription initiation factor RRN3